MKYAYHLLVENVEIRRLPGKTEKEWRRTYLVQTWICVILHYISNMHKKSMILEIEAIENAVTMVYIWLDYHAQTYLQLPSWQWGAGNVYLLCPIHVVTFTLISNLATDYIQKRRGEPGLFSFEYNLSRKLISTEKWLHG